MLSQMRIIQLRTIQLVKEKNKYYNSVKIQTC